MKDVSVYFVSVHSYDIDPHSYDVDPLERGQGFQRAVSVCLQTGSSIIAKILLFLSHRLSLVMSSFP